MSSKGWHILRPKYELSWKRNVCPLLVKKKFREQAVCGKCLQMTLKPGHSFVARVGEMHEIQPLCNYMYVVRVELHSEEACGFKKSSIL